MTQRPLILITPCTESRGTEFGDPSLSLSQYYARAVQAAGALPLVVPLSLTAAELAEAVSHADGVVLTGGHDVQWELHTQDACPRAREKAGAPDRQRDWLETALVREVFRQRKPLLAICRGQQLLNVALGGTLWIDIATEVPAPLPHCQPERNLEKVHEIAVVPDSRLAKIAGTATIGVNSCHHQAVRDLARPFRTVASSADGIVEAFELAPPERALLPYLLAVQFHPERLYESDPVSRRLLRDFTRACRRDGEGTV